MIKLVALLLALSPAAVSLAGVDRRVEIDCREYLKEDLGRKPLKAEIQECVREAKNEVGAEQGQRSATAIQITSGWFKVISNGLGRNWSKPEEDGWMGLLNGPKKQDVTTNKQ